MASIKRREALTGYGFISIWIMGFLFFTAGPIIVSMILGFTNYSIRPSFRWVGFRNYLHAFTTDFLFKTSIYNTIYYTAISVPLFITLSFSLAILLNAKIKGRLVFRSIYYIPYIMPAVPAVMIWLLLFQPQYGMLNNILRYLGVSPLDWLVSPQWSKPSLIIMSLWSIGGNMIIYLAGLQSIPNQLYEAAEIDGAHSFSSFLHVTIPMMSPIIFFTVIIGIINSFQIFTPAFIMTEGGPLNSTLFYTLHMYNNAFSYWKMGYASALAFMFFIAVLILTYVVVRTSKMWVHEAD